MNRYVITFASMLDALSAERILREQGVYASFVSTGRRDDEVATTVGLEVEVETASDSDVREILAKGRVTVLGSNPASEPSRAAS